MPIYSAEDLHKDGKTLDAQPADTLMEIVSDVILQSCLCDVSLDLILPSLITPACPLAQLPACPEHFPTGQVLGPDPFPGVSAGHFASDMF